MEVVFSLELGGTTRASGIERRHFGVVASLIGADGLVAVGVE